MPEFKQPKRRKKRTPPPKAEQKRTDDPVSLTEKLFEKKKPAATKSGNQPRPTKTREEKANIPNRRKHPRVQKKRQASRNAKQKRKGSFVLYYVLIATLMTAVFVLMSVTVLFNLDEIIIEGDSDYSDDEIIEASGIKIGANIIRINSEAAEERILDKLIWLDRVTIEKSLPRSIKIITVKSVPCANVMIGSFGSEYYVVSHTGRILEKTNQTADCTVVLGYEAKNAEPGEYLSSDDDEKGELLFKLISIIEGVGLNNITVIDMSDYMNITLNYENRITVLLGAPSSLEQKLKNTLKMLETEIAENEEGELKVSNLQKITFLPAEVKPEPEETTTEPETSAENPDDVSE